MCTVKYGCDSTPSTGVQRNMGTLKENEYEIESNYSLYRCTVKESQYIKHRE